MKFLLFQIAPQGPRSRIWRTKKQESQKQRHVCLSLFHQLSPFESCHSNQQKQYEIISNQSINWREFDQTSWTAERFFFNYISFKSFSIFKSITNSCILCGVSQISSANLMFPTKAITLSLVSIRMWIRA